MSVFKTLGKKIFLTKNILLKKLLEKMVFKMTPRKIVPVQNCYLFKVYLSGIL